MAVICINFIYSHIVCLYGHTLRLLTGDMNVRNVRIKHSAHMMSSTFRELSDIVVLNVLRFLCAQKIKMVAVCFGERIDLLFMFFCVYLQLTAVVHGKT